MLITLLATRAMAVPPEPMPGMALGASVGDERGLAGVLRVDLGPVAVEGSGGLSTIPVLFLTTQCPGAGLVVEPQVAGDVLVPALQASEGVRVGAKAGGGWLATVGGEGRVGAFADLSLGRHAFVGISGGFRVMPGLVSWTQDTLNDRCGSQLVQFAASPVSAFQQYLGAAFFVRF